MKPWKTYYELVEKNVLAPNLLEGSGLVYWRNKLFANIIIFLLPISGIAAVPGVIMSFKAGIPGLALYDTFAIIVFSLVAFFRRMKLQWRKTILLACFYLLAIALLLYLGPLGPGLIYLFAIALFSTLIFPVSIGFLTVGINTIITIAFAVVVHYPTINLPLNTYYDSGSWIAVSSNLAFLSILSVTSLNLLFRGLDRTISKEEILLDNLAKSEQNIKSLINNTTDLIWSVDRDLKYITFNEALTVMAGHYGASIDVGQDSLGTGFCFEARKNWEGHYLKALKGEKFSTDIDLIIPGGTRYVGSVSFNPIRNQDGEITGVGCFLKEITQRRVYEEKIEDQNEKLKEIAFLTSHSLRAPLANILGLVSVLDLENFSSLNNKELIKYIHLSAMKVDEVIHEIVDQTLLFESSEPCAGFE